MRHAKIVCTLGPASDSLRVIEDLISAGMAVARINASHGDTSTIEDLFERVREVDDRTAEPVATMLDLQGPEIRTTPTPDPVELESGNEVRFEPGAETTGDVVGLSREVAGVSTGDRILLDDGRIDCLVTTVDGNNVFAEVQTGGPLGSRKGVNIPGVDLDLEMVTEKDRADLQIVDTGLVDFVAASFVRDAEDVYEVNAALEDVGREVPIIAKIERADAVRNMDEIIDSSFGVMVARGDLGVECPMEDVPLMQKRIIRRSRAAGAPVITATEMLDSMVHSRRPTRAEASDVANAVLDGTDAVMLSGETAVGDHPVTVVETMDRIIREVESSEEYAELREQRVPRRADSRTDALARSGRYLARDLDAATIVVASESGYTARRAAKYRPGVPVIAATISKDVYRRLALSWGLRPHYVTIDDPTAYTVIDDAVAYSLEAGLAEGGDTVVGIAGMMREIDGAELTNTLKVHVAAERIATGRLVVAGRVAGPIVPVSDGDVSDIPPGAVILVPHSFDGEFSGDLQRIGGILSEAPGLTGYAAMVARELEIPMISDIEFSASVEDGTTVTVDGERGVVYGGEISTPSLLAERPEHAVEEPGS